MINQTFEKLYFSGREALGGRVRMGSDKKDRPWMTVVGIVRDERHNGMTGAIKEKFYVPHSQFAVQTGFTSRNMTLLVRTKAAPMSLAAPIKAEVKRIDPSLPVANVRPMTAVVDASIATPRLTGSLLTIFAGLALALAAIGVSGVLAYLVSRRRREIGIRMALGARSQQVVWSIARGVAGLIGVATSIGLVLTVLIMLALRATSGSADIGIGNMDVYRPNIDPVALVAIAAVTAVVGVAAAAIPARRAARMDPVVALRHE
jgi:ABC-type antimicrobial peptide transport system permease subunit